MLARKSKPIVAALILWFTAAPVWAQQFVATGKTANAFTLAADNEAASIYTDEQDAWLVQKAASLLQQDVQAVTGKTLNVVHRLPAAGKQVVIIGSMGQSPLLQQLAAAGKVQADGLRNQWEAYQLQVVEHPLPGIDRALVIAGSDKRGAAYGVFELSKQIGVSPWYWWADVPVKKKAALYIKSGRYFYPSPAVKYRGIFINDEAPAFSGWTREKFGGVNHHVYEKIFELLLRLKGNYLWPAMWGNAFNDDDTLNPQLADAYGIVMGTSHHEPMLRAQQEWKRYGSGQWNYETNKATLQQFWEKGIQNMGTHESIVTIGMRGDGDMPMTEGSNIRLLETIVADQRKIIEKVTGKPASQTPQLWALYKEVQAYYDKGMRVPDDVTLLLCDDNWGNIRKLPKLGEPTRAGGYGVYYHFDYVGDPRNYKWLNTNVIARVWEQMHLAYERGVNRIWIVNVGDLKPMEFPISFFLDYAWNPRQWPAGKLPGYVKSWAVQQFGEQHADAIARILTAYTQYNNRRKPELLSPDTYSLLHYREAENVAADYNRLLAEAEKISNDLPAAYKDAYYQLVLHPVQACANLNNLYVTVAKNRLYAKQGRAATNDLADSASALYVKDSLISKYYNTVLSGGKWNHMMDQTHIGYTYWQQPPVNRMPAVQRINLPGAAEMGVAVEGSESWWPAQTGDAVLPLFDVYRPQPHYLEIFNRGQQPFAYAVTTTVPWLHIQSPEGTVNKEQRVWLSVDWSKAPVGKQRVPVTITGLNGQKLVVYAEVNKPAYPAAGQFKGFVESDSCIAMAASRYTKAVAAAPLQWQTIPNIGRTGDGVTIMPVTTFSQTPGGNSAHLEYALYLFDTTTVNVQVYTSPSLDFNNNGGLRYAVSLDDAAPQVINLHANQSNKAWEQWVANNIIVTASRHRVLKPGPHVLKLWLVDAGVVLQKLVVDAGGAKPCYLGPPEQ